MAIDLKKLRTCKLVKDKTGLRLAGPYATSGLPPGHPGFKVYTVECNGWKRDAPSNVIVEPEDTTFWYDVGNVNIHRTELNWLWERPSLDDPKVRDWILGWYAMMWHTYWDGVTRKNGSEYHVYWPVEDTFWLISECGTFPKDPIQAQMYASFEKVMYSREWHDRKLAELQAKYDAKIEEWRKVAIPENHMAVRIVRMYYPEYEPEFDIIEDLRNAKKK